MGQPDRLQGLQGSSATVASTTVKKGQLNISQSCISRQQVKALKNEAYLPVSYLS
jgi:hypothetical protein